MTLSAPYAYRLEPLAPPSLPSWAAERRKRLAGVAVAGACVGVHEDLDASCALMLPHDAVAAARLYLPKRSTCALFARGYVLCLGGEHKFLDAPYLPRDGQAVADVKAIAQAGGAWREPTPDALPLAGDVVLIGRALPDGSPDPAYVRGTKATEHVLVATGLEGDILWSVDGGQPGVEVRSRRVLRVGRELWLGHTERGTDTSGRPLVGRRVVGWLSLGELPTPRDAYVPEGVDLTG